MTTVPEQDLTVTFPPRFHSCEYCGAEYISERARDACCLESE